MLSKTNSSALFETSSSILARDSPLAAGGISPMRVRLRRILAPCDRGPRRLRRCDFARTGEGGRTSPAEQVAVSQCMEKRSEFSTWLKRKRRRSTRSFFTARLRAPLWPTHGPNAKARRSSVPYCQLEKLPIQTPPMPSRACSYMIS